MERSHSDSAGAEQGMSGDVDMPTEGFDSPIPEGHSASAVDVPDTSLNRAILGLLNTWATMRGQNKFHTGKIQEGMNELAEAFFIEVGLLEKEESSIIKPDNGTILPRL